MSKTPLELLYGPQLKGGPFTDVGTVAGAFAGITSVPSGTASVVVSVTSVKSNSIVETHVMASTRIASGQHRGFEVSSRVDATSFTLTTEDGVAQARDVEVGWMIWNSNTR